MTIELIKTLDEHWARAFPRRFTAKQKEPFLDELERELQARGFATQRPILPTPGLGRLVRNRLLLTECEQPQVILMAHYDTATILPPWLTWLYGLFGHTRQILMSVVLVALLLWVHWLVLSLTGGSELAFYGVMLAAFITLLVPTPHNREDNTSGVIGLLALADWLQSAPELRARVQLVFLDNEENGLLGSLALLAHWSRQRHPFQQAAIINLDCISRGQVPLLVYHKQDRLARRLKPFLDRHLPRVTPFDMGRVPLSDNYTFQALAAVDITCVDPTLLPGGYYVPRIHDPADNDLSAPRLEACLAGLREFIQAEAAAKVDLGIG